jgi:2-dehydro-3-deoxyphosphogalactonate aldolase
MMTQHDLRFDQAFSACSMIAILRGIKSEMAEQACEVLIAAGFRIIEVPLNSPDPFDSIARMVKRFGDKAVIGAGTVTSVEELKELTRIGAALAISPHTDVEVIHASRQYGLVSVPGVLSATEAASALKLFPMEMIGVKGVKALRAVLPKDLRLIAVGGVDVATIPVFRAVGCNGFGIGSSLFKPETSLEELRDTAEALASCY